jgi:predicted DNA-binding ribbon-helix-helix protein
MRKSKVVKMAENKGVSVAELITQLYNDHQNQTAVAAYIGISQSRLSRLLREHNLAEKTIIVQQN